RARRCGGGPFAETWLARQCEPADHSASSHQRCEAFRFATWCSSLPHRRRQRQCILHPLLLPAAPCFSRRRGRFSLPPPPPRTPPRPPPFPLRLAANFGPFNRGGSRGEGKPPAPRSSGNQASGDGESRRHSAPPRLPPAKAPPPVT